MLRSLSVAILLMAVCVVIHGGGLAAAVRTARHRAAISSGFWPSARLFIGIAAWMILLHLSEISVWAAFYVFAGAMPDFAAALYFSAVTYTTTGYGDLVLPEGWRLVGGVEALTGILMCGWSTGFFFAIVNRLYEVRSR